MALARTMRPRCRLLEIAPELRNRIYEEVFYQDPAVTTTIEPDSQHLPALLFTCKRVNKEATAMYYANTSFTCHEADPSHDLLVLPVAYRSHIRKIRLNTMTGSAALRNISRYLNWGVSRSAFSPGVKDSLLRAMVQEVKVWLRRGFRTEQIEVPWLSAESKRGWGWVSLEKAEAELADI